MSVKRSATTKPAPPEAAAAIFVPEEPTTMEEPVVVEPFVIGPASPAGTPGFYMGIGTRPQTPAEHAARLGAAAGKFNDAGFIMGTLAPRPEWPGQPEPEPEP